MTRRQSERKAAQRSAHATRTDGRKKWSVSITVDGEPMPLRVAGVPNGAGIFTPKFSARKVRRLIVRASRRTNRA